MHGGMQGGGGMGGMGLDSPPAAKAEPASGQGAAGSPPPPPPAALRLICPKWAFLEGEYTLVGASLVEGGRGKEYRGWNTMPVWLSEDKEHCIFSDSEGLWKVGEHAKQDMEEGLGFVKSRDPHCGVLPHRTLAWLRSPGEGEGDDSVPDSQIRIVSV